VYRWLAGNLRLWTVQELVSRFARASQKHTGRSRNNLGMDSFVHTLSSRECLDVAARTAANYDMAMLFVCYAACRLHPSFVHLDTCNSDVVVDDDLENILSALVLESIEQRRDLPDLIADRLDSVLGLSGAEILKIATAACTYLDRLQLNDYIDGICSYEYVSFHLACEVMHEISAHSWHSA